MLTQFETKLSQKNSLSGSVYHFIFQLINPKEINFYPGQYLFLKIDGKTRLYSIASPAYQKDKVEFIVELVEGGVASDYLKQLKVGDMVFWYGPAGQFRLKDDNAEAVFLATGTGIAPIRSMIANLKGQNSKFSLFWGLRYYKDIYLFDELREIEDKTKGNFQFVYCLSREKDLSMIKETKKKYFFLGHLQDALNHCFTKNPYLFSYQFYLCGGRVMIDDLRRFLEKRGVAKDKMIFERF